MLISRFRRASKVATGHLLVSLLVAAFSAALVFGVWFPYPYRDLVGGRELFLILVVVDVICGPLLTLVVFNPLKPRRELTLDLSLVVIVQLAALTYGLYTVAQSRPVYLVFEVDRFRAVTMADIQHDALRPDLGGFHKIGWGEPQVIGARTPKDSEEMVRSLDLSLGGISPAARPDWWVPYEDVKSRVVAKSRPLDELLAKHPSNSVLIEAVIAEEGLSSNQLAWLPVTSFQSTAWIVVIDSTSGELRKFLPIDAF